MRWVLPLLYLLATPAVASDFRLDWPVDCTLGHDCHIQQYVDHDPGPGAVDFTCGSLSYDGHKGTDIALPSLAAMRAGVDVRAAAAGTVVGLRDGMADQIITDENRNSVKGVECGNGLVLRHPDGWVTQYCHLKKGSLQVAEGDRVETGTVLGQIGLSGLTQFPHLHLSLRKDKSVRDPFAMGLDPQARACSPRQQQQAWTDPVPYVPGGFLSAGFADQIPTFDAIKAGRADQSPLPRQASALVLWAYAFGARAGDRMELTITAPNGQTLFHTEVPLEKTQAHLFRAGGKRLRKDLAAGRYIGAAKLRRKGRVIDEIRHQMKVD